MKVRITGVNYLNTFPFRYGLEKFMSTLNWAEINYANPYECAQMLVYHQTNVALAPVAILAYKPHLQIVTNYCLSTNYAVQSVKIYSHKKIDKIKNIVLDYQSLSSVSLVKVLMRYYWKKEVEYIKGYAGFENNLMADAMLVIGDRTFELNGKFEYEYDLAAEWFEFTNMPFVFAAWISNTPLTAEQIYHLNNAFEYGLSHLDDVIQQTVLNTKIMNFLISSERVKTISYYLKNNMYYHLDDVRKQSIQFFLKLLNTIIPENVQL